MHDIRSRWQLKIQMQIKKTKDDVECRRLKMKTSQDIQIESQVFIKGEYEEIIHTCDIWLKDCNMLMNYTMNKVYLSIKDEDNEESYGWEFHRISWEI